MIPIPGLATLRALGVGLMVAGACSAGAGFYGLLKGRAQGRAEIQAKLDRAIAAHNAAFALAPENFRRTESELRDKVKAAQTTYTEREAQHASEIASVRAAAAADVAGLRRALSAKSAGGGAAAPDPAAARDDCASIAGELLGDGLQLQAKLAAAAEREADGHRTLLEAWPEVKP